MDADCSGSACSADAQMKGIVSCVCSTGSRRSNFDKRTS